MPNTKSYEIDVALPTKWSRSITPDIMTILTSRNYLQDKPDGTKESANEAALRVATCVASVEKTEEERKYWTYKYYKIITDKKFSPNTPCWTGAGHSDGSLAACFVLPIEDSMESIFQALKDSALIMKSGGGVGYSWDNLRPQDSRVGKSFGKASGPVSFMKSYNGVIEEIKQGGTRRGAAMACLSVNHPDIYRFIGCKTVEGTLSNFNISVKLPHWFMEAVANSVEQMEVLSTNGNTITIRPLEIFEAIASNAWKNGEPGVLFIDTINKLNVLPDLGPIDSTNPCGESPLLPYESCDLGSMNWCEFNMDTLEDDIYTAVRFLDAVHDASHYPIPLITENVLKTRKIGLGVMGVADYFCRHGVPYASKKAMEIVDNFMGLQEKYAIAASEKLGVEKGIPEACQKLGRRNATLTCVAPTGTISLVFGVSSGIEPLFALGYTKHVVGTGDMPVVNGELENYCSSVATKEQVTDILKAAVSVGSVQGVPNLPNGIKEVFRTALEIPVEEHLLTQQAFQKYVHLAVSKTINMPEDYTVEDIKKTYLTAWKLGLKGLTVYRNNSRETQMMTVGTKQTIEETPEIAINLAPNRKRGSRLSGATHKIGTGCGSLYVTINYDDQGPVELFATLGKSGGCANAQMAVLGKLATLSLRSGVDPLKLIEMLKGTRCSSTTFGPDGPVLSCADAVAKCLEAELGFEEISHELGSSKGYGTCPECGVGLLVQESGCISCKSCGFSRCG